LSIGWILLICHFIGAVIMLIILHKNGTFAWAKEHGDGIRFAKPVAVIYEVLVVWELNLIICGLEYLKRKLEDED